MRYLDLFSGIGGFALGIQQAYELQAMETESENSSDSEGGTPQHGERPLCIGYSEIDKYASAIYQRHFPDHINYGDITKINPATLPDFDFLCGGFPCQSFSIAGKRKGFDDTRGTLFFDIARILRAKQPRLFLLENVKGLLSHDNGNTFKTIISTLDELGYDLQWQVLNSKNHGVPQNRERVFIVGHSRGTPRPEVFPFGQGDSRDYETRDEGQFLQEDTAGALKARDYKDGTTFIQQLNSPTHSNDRIYGDEGISPTLNTMQGGRRQPKVVAWSKSHRTGKTEADKRRHNYGQVEHRIKTNGEFNTLSTGVGGGNQSTQNFISTDTKIRRLTPTECERLQGFPDGWTQWINTDHPSFPTGQRIVFDTQRYKTLGNAVTVNVIRDIMLRILQ